MATFKGYKGYKGKGSTGVIIPHIDLASLIAGIDLSDETALVTNEYYRQGYNGEFGRTSHFVMDTKSSKNPAAVLLTPAYTPFMLYGRGPGKMPPAEPIRSWMDDRGLTGSDRVIRNHIAKFGTTGNDFLTPMLGEIKNNIVQKIQDAISQALTI